MKGKAAIKILIILFSTAVIIGLSIGFHIPDHISFLLLWIVLGIELYYCRDRNWINAQTKQYYKHNQKDIHKRMWMGVLLSVLSFTGLVGLNNLNRQVLDAGAFLLIQIVLVMVIAICSTYVLNAVIGMVSKG